MGARGHNAAREEINEAVKEMPVGRWETKVVGETPTVRK
jgi:hypothetical protein